MSDDLITPRNMIMALQNERDPVRAIKMLLEWHAAMLKLAASDHEYVRWLFVYTNQMIDAALCNLDPIKVKAMGRPDHDVRLP